MRVFGSLPGHKQTFQVKNNVRSSLTRGHSSRQQLRQLCANKRLMHRSNGDFHLNRTATTTILVNTRREHFAPIDCAGNLCRHHATHTSVVLT
jgi:hypothetical protein